MTLDDRLRDAANDLRSAATPPVATIRRDRRPLALAVAAAVVVAIALVAVAARPDHDARVTTDVPAPATTSTVDRGRPLVKEATTAVWFGRWYVAGAMFNNPDQSASSPVVWASDDGQRWEETWRNPDGVALGTGATQTLYVVGGRLLLLSVGTGGTAAWWSDDGTTWQGPSYPGVDWVADGTWFHGRFITAGENKTAALMNRPATLQMFDNDDTTWRPLRTDLPGTPTFDHVAGDAEQLLLTGHASRDDGAPAVVWRSTDASHWGAPVRLGDGAGAVFELALDGGTAIAIVGRPSSSPERWVSEHGGAWHRVADSPFPAGTTVKLWPLGGEFVGLGFVGLARDGVLRRSDDGISWRDVDTGGRIVLADGVLASAGGDRVLVVERDGLGWGSRVIDLGG